MESENTATTTTTTATTTTVSSSSSTNWTIAGGSLVNSVTFESYISNGQEEEEEDEETTIANSNPTTLDKSPLILRPPSPDSNPCEIKSTFWNEISNSRFLFLFGIRVCEFSGKFNFTNCYMICFDLYLLVLPLYVFLFVSWNVFRENTFLLSVNFPRELISLNVI